MIRILLPLLIYSTFTSPFSYIFVYYSPPFHWYWLPDKWTFNWSVPTLSISSFPYLSRHSFIPRWGVQISRFCFNPTLFPLHHIVFRNPIFPLGLHTDFPTIKWPFSNSFPSFDVHSLKQQCRKKYKSEAKPELTMNSRCIRSSYLHYFVAMCSVMVAFFHLCIDTHYSSPLLTQKDYYYFGRFSHVRSSPALKLRFSPLSLLCGFVVIDYAIIQWITELVASQTYQKQKPPLSYLSFLCWATGPAAYICVLKQ